MLYLESGNKELFNYETYFSIERVRDTDAAALTGLGSKCFEWEAFDEFAYSYFTPQLHRDDFVYFDCIHGPLSEHALFNLYCFISTLNKKGVFWYLSFLLLGCCNIKEF